MHALPIQKKHWHIDTHTHYCIKIKARRRENMEVSARTASSLSAAETGTDWRWLASSLWQRQAPSWDCQVVRWSSSADSCPIPHWRPCAASTTCDATRCEAVRSSSLCCRWSHNSLTRSQRRRLWRPSVERSPRMSATRSWRNLPSAALSVRPAA